jgi:hypothetical protein
MEAKVNKDSHRAGILYKAITEFKRRGVKRTPAHADATLAAGSIYKQLRQVGKKKKRKPDGSEFPEVLQRRRMMQDKGRA